MASEWSTIPVSQLAAAVIGGTPSRNVVEYWHGNIPWATAKDVAAVSGRYLEHVEECITQQGLANSAAKLLPKGTVVITARGTVGAVAQLGRPMAVNQTCYALLPKEGLDNDFLFYALKGTTAEMQGLTYGTVFETITTKTFDHWPIPLPPLSEQRAIAHILGTLDDKIELNRRMSETLEAMARAIFKSWFVDFDPVRAKMEGRDPGLPGTGGLPTRPYDDLFPDRLVDSELGEIPEGWEVGTLGDYTVNIDSKRVPLSGAQRSERKGPYPYHGAAGVMDYVDDYLFEGVHLLVGEDGSVVQDTGLAVTQYVWGKFWVNNHAHVLKGRDPVSTEQLYLYFHFEPVLPYVTGAVQPKLSQGRMNAMPFIFAGEILCRKFEQAVQPYFARLRASVDETKTLATLRDALLPKLISGELRVLEAERFLKERGL